MVKNPSPMGGDDQQPEAAPVVVRTSRLPRFLTEPMWVLGLVLLMDEVDKNIVRGLIPQLKADFHVGDLAIGVLLSLALLFNGLITVPAGYLADRWNRSQAIGKTVIGWSILSAGGAASVGFPMLVGMRSTLGFGQAITEPSAASLIGDYYPPDQRGKAFSIQQVMLLGGTGLGVGLGGLIGTTLGWRPALIIVAIPGLLVSLLVFRLARTQARHGRHDGRDRRGRDRASRRRARQPLRARLPAVREGHDQRPARRHADDPQHPHDALRALRRRCAVVHLDGHRRVATAVLRTPAARRRTGRARACSSSSSCSAASRACCSAVASPTSTRRASKADASRCRPSSCSSVRASSPDRSSCTRPTRSLRPWRRCSCFS